MTVLVSCTLKMILLDTCKSFYFSFKGIGIDGPDSNRTICLLKKQGKVKVLEDEIKSKASELAMDKVVDCHVGISHTRWATHGEPAAKNAHPQRSNEDNKFIVVHNGIITNYKEVKEFLTKKGYVFESETDTEVIAKLVDHLHNLHPENSFRELVDKTVKQLEGAFACAFKSRIFPGEVVGTKRGSPLLVGIKTKHGIIADKIPIQFR